MNWCIGYSFSKKLGLKFFSVYFFNLEIKPFSFTYPFLCSPSNQANKSFLILVVGSCLRHLGLSSALINIPLFFLSSNPHPFLFWEKHSISVCVKLN